MIGPLKIPVLALNTAYPGRVNVIVTDVQICPAFDHTVQQPDGNYLKTYKAIWDTGATNSVITSRVANECGLKPIGATKVNTANGEAVSNVYLAAIFLPSRVRFPQVRVTEGSIGGGMDVLIGMDIISMGDFAVTNKDGKTNFSFRTPSVECIDFVKITNQTSGVSAKIGRNEPCPCGSGKKYKHCHGR